MRIGPLRHRVRILEKDVELDEYGAPKPEGWKEVASVWAAIEPVRGNEVFQSQQTQSVGYVRIRIRWRDDVNERMMVQHNGVNYAIFAVLQDNRGKETVLQCVRRSGDQEITA